MVQKDKYKIAFFILLVVIILAFLSIIYYKRISKCPECAVCQECETCPECPKEKPLIEVAIYDWGYNELDMSEILFQYWVYNFGDEEIKNIKVICKLIDINGYTQFSAVDTFGNLASKSFGFGEFTPKKTASISMSKEYSAVCYVESCDNCEMLYKRIPELVENLEE